jgi:hypothetical protein
LAAAQADLRGWVAEALRERDDFAAGAPCALAALARNTTTMQQQVKRSRRRRERADSRRPC